MTSPKPASPEARSPATRPVVDAQRMAMIFGLLPLGFVMAVTGKPLLMVAGVACFYLGGLEVLEVLARTTARKPPPPRGEGPKDQEARPPEG